MWFWICENQTRPYQIDWLIDWLLIVKLEVKELIFFSYMIDLEGNWGEEVKKKKRERERERE